jgi:nicotinamidase-related amidase
VQRETNSQSARQVDPRVRECSGRFIQIEFCMHVPVRQIIAPISKRTSILTRMVARLAGRTAGLIFNCATVVTREIEKMSKLEMLTPKNSAIALLDYQPAMYQGVQSHDRIVTLNNIQTLAKAAKLFNIPTVLSTIAKDSFSGPFMPEVLQLFPKHDVIDRTAMNAWLDAKFRAAVHATERKKIVIAGLWTEACVMFPVLDMLKEGFEIYIAADACGDLSLEAHNRSMDRAVQAGAMPITSFQYVFELQQDWARTETYEGVMNILREHSPYGIQVRFSKWALGENASES